MKIAKLLLPAFFICMALSAQNKVETKTDSWKDIYRGSATKINDLVNTKLNVRFDYEKTYMYGKAWITLKPHFYPTDSLSLDAKGMDIHQVALVKGNTTTPLRYNYDGLVLKINLDKRYKSNENYTVYIDYTS